MYLLLKTFFSISHLQQEKSEVRLGLRLLDNATIFQNMQERKTIANFCGTALHFDLNFSVEGLNVLID